MFGERKWPRKPKMIDANPRHICPDRFIRGRVPNSSHKYQKYLVTSEKSVSESNTIEADNKDVINQTLIIKHQKHNDKNTFKRLIRERVEAVMKGYDMEIDKRRTKMNNMLAAEESGYIKEIVKQTQSFGDQQYEEKRQKVAQAQIRNENERLKLVEEMKLLQYFEKCSEVRPLLSLQKAQEAAAAQKIQREENKMRKESENELKRFWEEVVLKRDLAMKDVVEQKALESLKLQKECNYILDCQMNENKAREEMKRQEKAKEAKIVEELIEKVKQEKIAEKERKRMLQERTQNELMADLKLKQERRKIEEEHELIVTRTHEKINAIELQREKDKITSKAASALLTLNLFSQYSQEVQAEKTKLENETNKYIHDTMEEITKKRDEEKFRELRASDALLKSCIAANEKMIEDKRREQERNNKIDEEERKVIEMNRQLNYKLQAEAAKQKKLAKLKYQDDLDNQIKYAETLKELVREKEKHLLILAQKEEERYAAIVAKAIGDVSKEFIVHPFKKLFNSMK